MTGHDTDFSCGVNGEDSSPNDDRLSPPSTFQRKVCSVVVTNDDHERSLMSEMTIDVSLACKWPDADNCR